jgi:hypothetical protein
MFLGRNETQRQKQNLTTELIEIAIFKPRAITIKVSNININGKSAATPSRCNRKNKRYLS